MIIKLCGLSTRETVAAAIEAGADMIGFVFFPKSPRNLSIADAAALAEQARGRTDIVALTVNADDVLLTKIAQELRPEWVQLHGHEDGARCAQVRQLTGSRILKAIAVTQAGEAAAAFSAYSDADMLLFDAKPPANADTALPGGNGVSFDWSLIADLSADVTGGRNYLMSGGLTPMNVGSAVRQTRCPGVDVSSGIERAPGEKDPALIRAFVAAAREAGADVQNGGTQSKKVA